MLEWLLGAAVGPAVIALPVNWAAEVLAGSARRWFKRLHRADDLSRLVRAATGTSADLAQAEFDAVRKLLEDQQTWTWLGQGSIDDLAERIAECLPPREGRTAANSHAAALAIARGLVEFAAADLDPKLFQRVLLTRLERIETGQASALDMALLGLHSRFAGVMDQLKLVAERLPPGPARPGEIVVYLRTLIDWLDTDPWPHDPQFDGPVLTPAAIERKLRVTVTGQVREANLDADELAQRCQRLVILGAPGSGKTWLARRTVRRCAEEALQTLTAGGTVDEVELPIYTTCSRLFSAGGDIREAVVSSALDQLADLGGSRISAALRVFFTERNAPTVLVIDSLDEAQGPSQRLRQAGTLPWRIVLTSRPSSWGNQLAINDEDNSHRVGELQPLRYPRDVEPFIHRWFAGHPKRGQDLAAQIARRPALQQAATVPLILAFYCIVGGSGPLPEFRRDLYTRVLNRMLTGRWRGDGDHQPNSDTCLRTLRAWAWSGAGSHTVSGVGMWRDDIPTRPIRLGAADADALDHVAPPICPYDLDTGKTLRRFIHRSIREHLVAGHVASLPVDHAVKALLPHLWYDPDWEHVVPAALAGHPERDQLVRKLICSAASSGSLPKDLSVIDAGWQIRELLARVAAESSEADWSPGVADLIGEARADLARSGRCDDLGGATSWTHSNRRVREALLRLLADETLNYKAGQLIGVVAQLDPTAEDKRQAREALRRLLSRKARTVQEPGFGFYVTPPTAESERQAHGKLLGMLARETSGETDAVLAASVIQLAATAEDKRQAREALLGLLAREADGGTAAKLAGDLVPLTIAAEDKRQAREALLGLLAREADGRVAVSLAGGLVPLAATVEDKRQAREALLGLLAREADGPVAVSLAGGLASLDPTAQDKRQAREALLRLLARNTYGWVVVSLAVGLASLDPTAEDKRQVRAALLGLLVARETGYLKAGELVAGAVQFAMTAQDERQVREALLGLLAREADGRVAVSLAGGLASLDPTAQDKRQARQALLRAVARSTEDHIAEGLVAGVIQLATTAEDDRQVREALLGLLAREADGGTAVSLAGGLIQLTMTAEDERQVREALLGLLAREADGGTAAKLAGGLAHLDPTAQDKRQAREALLRLLVARETYDWVAADLAGGLAHLDPTAQDKRQARQALLRMLSGSARGQVVSGLAGGLARLATTAEDKRQAREALLAMLSRGADSVVPWQLAAEVVELDPTANDLKFWRAWGIQPTAELLATARRNSALTEWLEAVPLLASLSGSPA